jgi:predicted enzyme involved in methoxymalonyl-ACP biosynthesis
VIVAQVSPDRRRWTLDSVLMSCRVLGRGVETTLIGALAEDARAEGAVEFVASYIPTAKNAICAKFLPDQGFTQVDERTWRLDLADAPAIPAHITRLGAPAAKPVQLADVAG